MSWQASTPNSKRFWSRRDCLTRSGSGFGLLGLAALLGDVGALATPESEDSSASPRHGPVARAKSVIWCFMYGGPSGIDLFDHKPDLEKYHGRPFDGAAELQTFSGKVGPLMRPPFGFQRYGECGQTVSELYPNIARHVDSIAFLKACHVETNVHDQALFQVNTGMTRLGFPSAGSWITYGLGSENRNLPGYIVMYDPRGIPVGGAPLWSSGFLPSIHGGTVFRSGSSPILNLQRPAEMSAAAQRRQLDLVAAMNRDHLQPRPGEDALEARIESFELAFRMQTEAPSAVDLSGESDETKRLYGIHEPSSRSYGTQLLMARRLVERGCRMVQVYSGGTNSDWDSHSKLEVNHRLRARETDAPVAGLLADLKRLGLLEETLVIWGGEFGRLPMSEGGGGRDHNPHGFLMWMAGGGVQGGTSYGATDEIGFRAAENPVSVHDVHATILHLLGLDHTRLTYRHNGRDFRLTDVAGNVIREILV